MIAPAHRSSAPRSSQPALLSVGQVAQRYGLCVNTVRSYCDAGKFEVVRTLGGRGHRRIDQRSVEVALGLVSEIEHEEQSERKTVCYCRVSSAQQKTEGALDRQIDFLTEWTKEKYGTAPDVYADCASSFGRRPQLERLIFDVIEGKISKIIVKDSSRWSRVPSTSSLLESICKKYHVEIVVVEDEPDQDEINILVSEMANYCQILCSRMSSRKSVKVRSFQIEGDGAKLVEREFKKGTAISKIREKLYEAGHTNPRTGGKISAWKVQQHLQTAFPEESLPVEGAHPVDRFLDSGEVVINSNARITSKELYQTYRTWTEKEGVAPLGKYKFGLEIVKRGYDNTRSGGVRKYRGIGIGK